MSEPLWIAIITGAFGLLTAVATGIAAGLVRVVNLILDQSRNTITNVQQERDYWKAEAMDCRKQKESE